jgi:hypothetical protein
MTCEKWREAFTTHFDSLRDLQAVMNELGRKLDEVLEDESGGGDSAATATRLTVVARDYARKVDDASHHARTTAPQGFFGGFDAELTWTLPVDKFVLPLGFPTMPAGLRLVSDRWETVRAVGGLLGAFFDDTFSLAEGVGRFETASTDLDGRSSLRAVSVRQEDRRGGGAGAVVVSIAVRPYERCLMEPTFGGRLAAAGPAGLVAPLHLLLDLGKEALFEDTLRPDGNVVRRTFGEMVRVQLTL